MFIPDFFIIGAPKCGTTSLDKFLTGHPDVRMASFKEPHFFSQDIGWQVVKSREKYESLFDITAEKTSGRIYGESSVFYLYSDQAISTIESCRSDVKYIILLRNPIDMLLSLHAENRKSGDEVHRSFESAWRNIGRSKRRIRNPVAMNYKLVGRLGFRIEKLLDIVPRERVLFIELSEFVNNWGYVMGAITSFLEIPPSSQVIMPFENMRREYRSITLNRLIASISDIVGPKSRHREILKKIGGVIRKLNMSSQETLGITPLFRRELEMFFADDTQLLRSLTGKRLV